MKTLKKTLAVLMAVLMLFSTMAISASAAEGEATTVAYFVNTDNWAEVVAHVWVDGGEALNTWPGEACTLVDGTDNVYAFDMTTGNRIIFNNNDAGAQTDNLNGEDAIGKYYEPKTKAFYATAEEAQAAADAFVPVTPSGDANTVYFVNTVNWEAVYGHVWGGTVKPGTAWPGEILTADGNVYAYDIYDSTGLVFDAGDGMPQTGDITVTADIYGKYYEFTSNAWYNSVEEAVAAVQEPSEPAEKPETELKALEPTPLDKMEGMFFVIAGTDTLCGSGWDPTDMNNELVYNEETRLYEKTYTDVAAGTYSFKVTTDGQWDLADFNLVGDAKFGGPDATITVAEDASTVKVVFDYQRAYVWINDEQVKVEVEVVEPTEPTDPPKTEWVALEPTPLDAVADTYFVVAGVEALCGSSWEPTDKNNELVYNEETRLYEKTYTDVADGTYEFKITTNGDWANPEFNLYGDAKGQGNAQFTVAEAGATVKVVFDNQRAYVWVNDEQVKVEVEVQEDSNPTESTEPTEETKPMTAKAAKKVKAGATTTVTVENAEGKVTFKSSNKKVAKVSAKGVVTGLTKGTVTITATDEAGNTATVKVKVSSSPKLSSKSVGVKAKKSATVTVKGAATKVKVTKCKIAKITVKGTKITVTGKKKGSATVDVKVNGTKLKLAIKVK